MQAVAEEPLDGRACWRLELEAKRPAISARQVVLWVAKEGSLPLKAEFRLASGRLARTARFGPRSRRTASPCCRGWRSRRPAGLRSKLAFGNWIRGGVAPGAFDLPGTDR